jgi:hypothetical protein
VRIVFGVLLIVLLIPLLLIMAGVIGGLLGVGLVGLFIGPVVLAVTYKELCA